MPSPSPSPPRPGECVRVLGARRGTGHVRASTQLALATKPCPRWGLTAETSGQCWGLGVTTFKLTVGASCCPQVSLGAVLHLQVPWAAVGPVALGLEAAGPEFAPFASTPLSVLQVSGRDRPPESQGCWLCRGMESFPVSGAQSLCGDPSPVVRMRLEVGCLRRPLASVAWLVQAPSLGSHRGEVGSPWRQALGVQAPEGPTKPWGTGGCYLLGRASAELLVAASALSWDRGC